MDAIANLSPNRMNGELKARVYWKTAKSSWKTQCFDGKLFCMDLMDAYGDIVMATAFKDECEKFFDLIEVGNVYIFSGYDVKSAEIGRHYWPHEHKFEIKFTYRTTVQLCKDDDDIIDIQMDLLPISDVWKKERNEFVDTIGFCIDVDEMDAAETPSGFKPIRNIALAHPMSEDFVTLTLWYDEAKNFDGQVGSLILVRGSRINIWDGVTKLNGGQVLKINANTPEAHNPPSDTRILTLRLGINKLDYLRFEDVTPESQHYRPLEYYSENRLLVNMILGNWTSNRWVTCFNDAGKILLKHAARFHYELSEVIPAQVKYE